MKYHSPMGKGSETFSGVSDGTNPQQAALERRGGAMKDFIKVWGTAYSASALAETGDSGSAEKIMEEIQPESSPRDVRQSAAGLQAQPQAT